MTISPLQTVITRIEELIPHVHMNPGVAMRTYDMVNAWLAAGCDVQLDILPAINKAFVRCPGKISSPQYFDGAVRKAMQDRTQDPILLAEKAAFRIEALRWKKERGLYLNERELAELAQHEQQYQSSTSADKAIVDSGK